MPPVLGPAGARALLDQDRVLFASLQGEVPLLPGACDYRLCNAQPRSGQGREAYEAEKWEEAWGGQTIQSLMLQESSRMLGQHRAAASGKSNHGLCEARSLLKAAREAAGEAKAQADRAGKESEVKEAPCGGGGWQLW